MRKLTMKTGPSGLLFGLALSLLVGCAAESNLRKLPAYDQAVAMPGSSEPRCYYMESVDGSQLPTLVPFATVTRLYGNSKDSTASSIAREAATSMKPDAILFYEGGSVYAGSVSSGSAFGGIGGAFGIGISQPMYAKSIVGVCCRRPSGRLGIELNDSGMVTSASESARAAGLLEGDTLLSVDDAVITLGAQRVQSPDYAKLLGKKPGETIKLIWIRPGSGRMEGRATITENPPLTLPPSVEAAPPPVPSSD